MVRLQDDDLLKIHTKMGPCYDFEDEDGNAVDGDLCDPFGVLQCVADCCSVLQCVAGCVEKRWMGTCVTLLIFIAGCCSVLQCVWKCGGWRLV